MSDERIMKEIEEIRAKIKQFEDAISVLSKSQRDLDRVFDKIAEMEAKLDKLLG